MTTFSSIDLEETFIKPPQNVSLNSSGIFKAKIYCTAPQGYPNATLSWKRILSNGTIVPVVQDDRVKIRREWLSINNAQINDTGFYQCVANNTYCERISHRAYLGVAPGE